MPLELFVFGTSYLGQFELTTDSLLSQGMHRRASSKPCRPRWKSIRKISPLHWVPIGWGEMNLKRSVSLFLECTNCDAGRFYMVFCFSHWDGFFLLKLAVVQIFRGGGVWLQFTSRDYDEPEDNVSSHPTHGAVGDFWWGWRNPLRRFYLLVWSFELHLF